MAADLLTVLPTRQGHFLLESGYHASLWLSLDALFVDPARMAPLVAELADRLRRHDISAVCGPLLGGAFLAQALAAHLSLGFYYAEPGAVAAGSDLFGATYRIPLGMQAGLRGGRFAVVDDAVSAGSSVRATIGALSHAGATTVAVGTLLLLGDLGAEHFAAQNVPVEALGRRQLTMWKPGDCPLCREGQALVDPRGDQSPVAVPGAP